VGVTFVYVCENLVEVALTIFINLNNCLVYKKCNGVAVYISTQLHKLYFWFDYHI